MKFEMQSFQISITNTWCVPYNSANMNLSIYSQRCIYGSFCDNLAAYSLVQQFLTQAPGKR
jgi:hypothetical protein